MRHKNFLALLAVLLLQGSHNSEAQAIKDPRLQPIKQTELKQLITKTPLNSPLHGMLIGRARRSKLLAAAYTQYDNIWRQRPRDAYANHWRAVAAYQYEWQSGHSSSGVRLTGAQKGRLWEAARAGFKKAIELKPDFAAANSAYGAFLVNIPGEEQKGLDLMRKAVKLDPKAAGAWRSLGEALINPYGKYHNPADGEAALQKAAQLDPLFAAPHAALLRLYVESKRYKDAQRELQLYVDLAGAENAEPTVRLFKPEIDKALGTPIS